jgi:transposase-like protein
MTIESTQVKTVQRRRFSVEEKRRIVAEYRAAADGTRGEVLRREGIYQSAVFRWGQQIDAGTLGGPRKERSGPSRSDQTRQIRALQKRLARAEARNATLEELVAAQGIFLALTVADDTASANSTPTP